MRTQLNVRLPESHIERLRQMAEGANLSQSETIMRLIDAEQGRRDALGALGGIFLPLGATVTMLKSGDLSFEEAHDQVHRSDYVVRVDDERIGCYLDGEAAVMFEVR
jgi:hypothetical protein